MRILCTAKIAGTTPGHIDHALAYAVGFKSLGHEVLLMDHVGRGRCVDASGQPLPFAAWPGRAHFEAVARAYGLWPQCCLVSWKKEALGLTYAQAAHWAKGADLLIARSGNMHKLPDIFYAPACRALFDGNPGSTQTMYAQQHPDAEPLHRYEHRFTLGLNIGTTASPIPCSGLSWHTLPRPVVLPLWPPSAHSHGRFTTISTWKGRATFELEGVASGDKADNWLNYLPLPQRTAQAMEIALRVEPPAPDSDRALFEQHGWTVSDPRALSDLERYRSFIAQSQAEFSVAHNRYVAFNTGWFSDRSATYLASGKPVVVQSTGMEAHLPVGKGLLTFRTPEEAAECIAAVHADYALHARAATDIALEHFDARRVLRRVLERLG